MEHLINSLITAGIIMGIVIFIGIVLRIAIKPIAQVSIRQQTFERIQTERDNRYEAIITQMDINNKSFEKFTGNAQDAFEKVNQNLFKAIGGLELVNLHIQVLTEQTKGNTKDINCIKREMVGIANHVNFKTTLNDKDDCRVSEAV